MFESDDWDLDQDFLNDVDDKATEYCSQRDDLKNEAKRRKIEINDDPILSSNYNVDSWEKKTVNKILANRNENKELRKNLVLEMFDKNLPDKNISQDVLSDPKRSCDNTLSNTCVTYIQSCENNQLPRKNLVLEILKNKNAQDESIKNNRKNVELRKTPSKIKSNNNITAKYESTLFNDKVRCKISKNNSETENSSNNDNFRQHSSKNLKKELLRDVSKQQSIDNIESKNNLFLMKPPQIQSNKKMTLIRKFPGPAGLLPDDIDSNVPCVSYLNSLDESEASEETDSNNLSEYCSQNTKNLFTEGAWQLMLNDLPHNFLKGHNIATVKQMATLNGSNSTKIDFLAGIIEHIDFNHDNPPIVLKDFTDNIQGIVHKDIPLKYPGLLEPNVVVLLHDVGLLKISGTFVSNKYQILISPSSLLAIYTGKGTIECTEYMESVFGNISDGRAMRKEKEEGICISATALETDSSETCVQFHVKNSSDINGARNFGKRVQNTDKKGLSVSSNLKESDENTDEPMDFDSDISFSVSPTKITDSQNQKNFNSSMSKNLKHIKQGRKNQNSKESLTKEKENDDKERAKNLLKSLKRFTSNTNERKHLSHNSKTLQANTEHATPTNTYSKKIESEISKDTFFKQMDTDECDINISPEKTNPVEEKTVYPSCYKKTENNLETNTACVRSKLLQFKNADTLTLPENRASKATLNLAEKNEKLGEKKSPETSSSMREVLDDTENNSDDEMLSQLDMDIIFSNYNNKS